jgi:GT2 family glycosyltransferase
MRKAGYTTLFTPEAVISHSGQGSSNREFAVLNIYRGLLNFYGKRKSKIEYGIIRLGLQIKAETVYILGRITHNSYYTKTYAKALELF